MLSYVIISYHVILFPLHIYRGSIYMHYCMNINELFLFVNICLVPFLMARHVRLTAGIRSF